MKRLVLIAAALTLTLNSYAAGIDILLRFSQAWGLLTPSSQSWNTLQDYEEIQLFAGVQAYHSDFTDSYLGASTRTIRDVWISPMNNSTVYYRTQFWSAQTGWQTDYGAFPIYMEKRTFVCVRYQGQTVLAYQTCQSDTTLWLEHRVMRYPTQAFNTGPASIPVTVNWWYNTLLTGCTGSTSSGFTASTHTVGRNSTRRDIPLPINNIEITGLQHGWVH